MVHTSIPFDSIVQQAREVWKNGGGKRKEGVELAFSGQVEDGQDIHVQSMLQSL